MRIAIVGCGGAGKSTLARRLGALLDIPVVHLDHHYWQPGWVPTPADAWRARQTELLAGVHWIADGNYSGTMDIRFSAADLVLLLDFPRRVRMRRVLWRIARGWGRDGQAPGCPERWDWTFLRWVWRWDLDSRRRVLRKLAEHGRGARQVLLASDRDVEWFVQWAGRTRR